MDNERKVDIDSVEEVVSLLRDIRALSEENKKKIEDMNVKIREDVSVFLDKAGKDFVKLKEEYSDVTEKLSSFLDKKENIFYQRLEEFDKSVDSILRQTSKEISGKAEQVIEEKIKELASEFKETIKDMDKLAEHVSSAVTKTECKKYRENITKLAFSLSRARIKRPPPEGKRWSMGT